MCKRWLSCLPLFVLLAAPLSAQATQPKQEQPTVVVRLKSLDSLFDNIRLVVNPLLKKDFAGELEELIKTKVGPKGLEGIDPKRPIGLYGKIVADLTKVSAVVMLPVDDEKTFLTTLDNLNFKSEKDATGLYTVKQNALPVDVFFRFANKYAYVTMLDSEAIDPKNLAEPRTVFAKELRGFLSVSLRLEQIPDAVKQMILQGVAEKLDAALEKKGDNETKAQHTFRVALIREVGKQLTAAVRDGKDLDFEVDVDKRAEVLRVDVQLTGQPNSELAGTISRIGEAKSLFGGLMHKDAALNVLLNVSLPEKLREALNLVIDEGGKKAVEETKEEGKKIQVAKLLEALMPSLKSGELDAAVSLRGPSIEKTYTLVAAVKMREVNALTTTLLALLKDFPKTEQVLIKLNAAKVGDVNIHRIDAQAQFDAKTKAAFGDNPIYVAFRKDAVFVVLGDDGLAAIKGAIAAPATSGPPIQFEMSLSRMAQVFATTDADRKTAEKLLRAGKSDRVRVTLEGGASLRIRLEAHLSVLETLSQLGGLAAVEQKKEDKEKE